MLDIPQSGPSLQTRTAPPPLIEVRDLNFWYGRIQALYDVSFDVFPSEILALIGPSGCGKSTVLKCLNRMHDGTRGVRIEGRITMNGQEIHDPAIDPPLHRRRFGWVAQKPNPFAFSIHENVAYGARLHGLTKDGPDMEDHVESCLRRAHLWDEVKDDLMTKSGLELSGGQQQRLCIARALSTRPEVMLMDEPTGSIDPIATALVEAMMTELKSDISIVVITHSMMEARRIADRVGYFHLGKLLEIGPAAGFFNQPRTAEAAQFLHGKLG